MEEFLKSLREANNMTQADLARLAKTSQPQINRLEKGERELTRNWAERLAPHLGISPVRLIFPDMQAGSGVHIRARLISWVSAGALILPDADPDIEDAPWVYAPDLDPEGDWIALRVDGDSMNRVSPHGSIIFVNRKDKRLLPDADYVIGDGEGGATYKRYRPPNSWVPFSTNPKNKPFVLPAGRDPEIIGRVRKTLTDQ